ncbi:MAG: TonB family protein [Ignavibacteria bacterium]|jgi:TonB family protein|nr:TonB family protein [Ignavibacteria bacterium]
MKKAFFIPVICALIFYSGCKTDAHKNTNNHEINYGISQTYDFWPTYDDMLDEKSSARVDTALFRLQMNELLPPEKIFELFGSGYHNFYLQLVIKENESSFRLCTDASFWRGRGEDTEDMLYTDSKGQFPRHRPSVRYSKNTDKKITHENVTDNGKISVFYSIYPDAKKIFIVKPGIKNGKPVRSSKLYEISVFIGKDKKIARPWSIKEVNISKYLDHIYEKNVDRFWYSTGLAAVSIDGFESVRKAISYPEEALKNGVTGRVIVEIFADEEGNFAGYQLLKGLGYGCDEAVIKAIKDLKPKTYPTGQRSSIIVPFEFGPPQTTPIDLAVQLFDVNPDPNVYNNIRLGIINKNKTDKNLDQKYFVYVYIDKHLVFQTLCNGISKSDAQQFYWFRFQPNKPGTYDYTVYIDPENRLNDSNRENNTVHGVLAIK